MATAKYVHVDVPLSYFCSWLFYYTYHSDMDAPSMYTFMYLQTTCVP